VASRPPTPAIDTIQNAEHLSAFRVSHLTPSAIDVSLDRGGGRVHVRLPHGAGKTHLIGQIVARALRGDGPYDLVVVLTARKDILREQPWARGEADGGDSRVRVLTSRPREDCGTLDEEWREHERAGCTDLAKSQVCGACPRLTSCTWRSQLTKENLRGARVIGATQAYLAVVLDFVALLQRRTGAVRVLVILDEAAALEASFLAQLSNATLRRSRAVFVAVQATTGLDLEDWIELHDTLLDPSRSLHQLPLPRRLPRGVVEALQNTGRVMFDRKFRFCGRELRTAMTAKRWRTGGGIAYVRRPQLRGADLVIAAAGLPVELVRHRLGDDTIQEHAPGVQVLHAGTRIYNVAHSAFAAKNFPGNARQIAFVVAQLIAAQADQGRRSIVLVRKKLFEVARRWLERSLRLLTGREYRVLCNPPLGACADPLVVPAVTFGVRGINAYEEFSAAFAMCSYNVNEAVLASMLNDVHAPDERVELTFEFEGGARRLAARGRASRRSGFDELARHYQYAGETGVAEQAAARVRFATRERLVLLAQSGELSYPATQLGTLDGLRAEFGLLTERAWLLRRSRGAVAALAVEGATPAEIQAALGLSRATVYRRLARSGVSRGLQ
jgi:hypothetical protein